MIQRASHRILASVLGAGLALGLAGCGAAGDTRIGVAISNMDDSFVASVRRSIESEARGKARLSVLDGRSEQQAQSEQLETFIADKVEALIVNPVETGDATSIVFRAKSAGIPIVLFSRDISTVSINMWDKAYLVGVNLQEADALQVQILAEYWKEDPSADKNQDGRLQYVLIRGNTKQLATEASDENRKEAFDEAGIRTVELAEAVTNWTRMEGRKRMAEAIAKVGAQNIEAVICGNDEMALGAIEALKVAGYLQKGSYIPVVGVDGSSFALDAIADGSLLGTVRGDPDSQGRAAFDLAYALAKGTDPAAVGWALSERKYIRIPYQKVTRDNIKSFSR